MDTKEVTFGDSWWHRALTLFYYVCYVIDYIFIIPVGGSASYFFLVEGKLSLISSIFASGGIVVGLFVASIAILEAVRYIFFYVYKNKIGHFKSNFIKVFKRKSTIITLILIFGSLSVGTILGYREIQEIKKQEQVSLEKVLEQQENNAHKVIEKNEKVSREDARRMLRVKAELDAVLKVRSDCNRDIKGDYDTYYGICGNNNECLKNWFDDKGYSGDMDLDIENCVKIRS